MNMKKNDTGDLFSEFDPVSTDEWERVIREDLGGADYRKKLRWATGEGIDPLPFYRREDMKEIPREGPLKRSGDWQICQQIYAADIAGANREADRALRGGADSLRFRMRIGAVRGMSGGDLEGTPVLAPDDLEQLLEGIPFPDTPLHFDCGPLSPVIMAMLHRLCIRLGRPPEDLRGTLMDDPFRYLLEHGHQWSEPLLSGQKGVLSFAVQQKMEGMRCLGIDLRLAHEAGATAVQELGIAMAAASEYLAAFTEEGFAPEEIARQIHFTFPVGSLYFPEMAKLRAVRLLWKNLVSAYGSAPVPPLIHGESSAWNKTLYDPHTNLLRTATEGMSAAIAGCDLLTLHPFDHPYRPPTERSTRMSRNTQVIMKEEGRLNRVADPGAGSWYVEKLTEQLAEKGWEFFREIEQQGGLLQSVRSGFIHSAIEKMKAERDRRIAFRERVFVGTNRFPDPEDRAVGRIKNRWQTVSLPAGDSDPEIDPGSPVYSLSEALEKGTSAGDLIRFLKGPGEQVADVLTPWRGAAAFEAIRMETEQHGRTPVVLMLPLGSPKMRKARSAFAAGMLGCAGYRIEEAAGFDSLEEAVDRITEVAPDVVVLCSSDEEYPALVEELDKQWDSLPSPKPLRVLAGDPGDRRETYLRHGIDRFIHARCNVLETLRQFQEQLGITGQAQPVQS